MTYYWPGFTPNSTSHMEDVAFRSYIDTTYNNLMILTISGDEPNNSDENSDETAELSSTGYMYNALYYIDDKGFGHQVNRYSYLLGKSNYIEGDPRIPNTAIENQNIVISKMATAMAKTIETVDKFLTSSAVQHQLNISSSSQDNGQSIQDVFNEFSTSMEKLKRSLNIKEDDFAPSQNENMVPRETEAGDIKL